MFLSRVLRQKHILKTFDQLQKGDIVFKPEINHWKNIPSKLLFKKYDVWQDTDYGNYWVNEEYKLEQLDDDFKSTGIIKDRHYDGYGSRLRVQKYNTETGELEPKRNLPNKYNIGDIIAFPYLQVSKGYIELTEYHSFNTSHTPNHWLGIIYDNNMNKIDNPNYNNIIEETGSDTSEFEVLDK